MEKRTSFRLIGKVVSMDCVPQQRLGESTYEYSLSSLSYQTDIFNESELRGSLPPFLPGLLSSHVLGWKFRPGYDWLTFIGNNWALLAINPTNILLISSTSPAYPGGRSEQF